MSDRWRLRRTKDHDPAQVGETALSVAAAGCLRNRIETSDCSIDHRKVEIDARLDELRGHDANRALGRG